MKGEFKEQEEEEAEGQEEEDKDEGKDEKKRGTVGRRWRRFNLLRKKEPTKDNILQFWIL